MERVTFGTRELRLLNKNLQLIEKQFLMLRVNYCEVASIVSFSRRVFRKVALLIDTYWRILQKKGLNISFELYRTLLKDHILYNQRIQQRLRMMAGMPEAIAA